MGNLKKLSLQEELKQDVQQIEKEIEENPELERIQVTEEMDAALLSKIQNYEKEKAEKRESRESRGGMEESASAKRMAYRRKKKLQWFAAAAAVIVMTIGIGSTSIGSKSYLKELLDVLMGEESARVINVEDMEKQKTEDIDEIKVYKEIGEKLGITPIELIYKPKGMVLESYEIDESFQLARLSFAYQGRHIRYSLYASREDSSWMEKEEDSKIGEYVKTVDGVKIMVEEIDKPSQNENTRVARFEYQGVHYELKGELKREEMDKILENLYFL